LGAHKYAAASPAATTFRIPAAAQHTHVSREYAQAANVRRAFVLHLMPFIRISHPPVSWRWKRPLQLHIIRINSNRRGTP
jgi:hypothetical protein